jgi:HTH-type transcriptional regulator/antitoxin HigA
MLECQALFISLRNCAGYMLTADSAWSNLLTMSHNTEYRTPGQFIQALLDERGWTQRVLAIILDADETGINRLVADKRPVTAQLAIILGELFNVEPEKFLELQKQFDLAHARLDARPDPSRTNRAHLFGRLPITEMIKRGWIAADDVRNVDRVEEELTRFFGVSSPDEIEILPHAAKKTNIASDVTPAQLAWLYRVRELASEMLVAKYAPRAVRASVAGMKDLLLAAEEARKVPRILTECGIRYLLVESLTGSKIDGVCFWLNDSSPVVAMSLRYDRIDNFWFVLRHELEHVLRLHGRTAIMLDVELEGERAGTGANVADEERVANEAAAEFCVSQKSLERFIIRKEPFFAERDILGFARTLNIHPGLVAGQLQHRINRYDLFRNHLARIRHIVAPSALVDGWGDVAPVGL